MRRSICTVNIPHPGHLNFSIFGGQIPHPRAQKAGQIPPHVRQMDGQMPQPRAILDQFCNSVILVEVIVFCEYNYNLELCAY